MAPPEQEQEQQPSSRPASSSAEGTDESSSGPTRVFLTPDGASYVVCDSKESFVNPTTTAPPPIGGGEESSPPQHPRDIVKQLNVDLGQTVIQRRNRTLLWIVEFLDGLLVRWWEAGFFRLWNGVPLGIRRALAFGGWKVYFALHRLLLGRRTGLHPSQSEEYHALTTLAWGSRFFPATPRRMRFSLSQLHVCTPHAVPAHRIERIEETVPGIRSPPSESDAEEADYPHAVRGIYMRRHKSDDSDNNNDDADAPAAVAESSSSTTTTIFWVYGGAYLAGNAEGSSAVADWVGTQCGADVFVPEFRLAPEADIRQVLWDVCLAYRWLCARVGATTTAADDDDDPTTQKHKHKIVLVGVSSGGAIATRLMQYIAEHDRNLRRREAASGKEELLEPPFMADLIDGVVMPKAAVLFGPYVDYTHEHLASQGTFHHYARLDLVVTESVQEYGLPYLDDFIPPVGDGDGRREHSPVYRDMRGLPPLCVVVSEHEAVYDMTISLVNRARSDGVSVTLGVWKYMCHVFSFLFGFVPEGRISMEFVCDWIRQQQLVVEEETNLFEPANELARVR